MIVKVGDFVRAIPGRLEVGKGRAFEDTRWWIVFAIDPPAHMFELANGWWYETTQFEYEYSYDIDSPDLAPTSPAEVPSWMDHSEIQALDIHLSPESAGKIRKHLQRLADLTLSRSEKQELDTLISEIPI